jgi:hypothetical protein
MIFYHVNRSRSENLVVPKLKKKGLRNAERIRECRKKVPESPPVRHQRSR